MKNLKQDFAKRLKDNQYKEVFSTFSGKNYTSIQIESYYFSIINNVDQKSNSIVFLSDPSTDSHILSTFLILSGFDVYLTTNLDPGIINLDSSLTIITLSSKMYNQIEKLDLSNKLIKAYSIDQFLKLNKDLYVYKDQIYDYHKLKNIGKSIFLSSGSTGNPKIIPLNYDQINSCYNNVCNGFLSNLNFQNILSLHDTSFVIILPFIFCLASKNNTKLVASDFSLAYNPILSISSKIKSINNFILISVPSIFRLLFKLHKKSFENIVSRGSFISCGEPLDKNLAYKIKTLNPHSFFNLYGSTEVSPWILYLNVIDFIDGFNSINDLPVVLPAGKELPGVNVILSKDEELLVSSDSVFYGYENQVDSSPFLRIDSYKFFQTGDQFQINDQFYYCKGRLNSSVKIGGIFVNPILLEIEIKEAISIENIIILPEIFSIELIIVIFNNQSSSLDKSIINKIKDTIYNNISRKIPTQFVFEKKDIMYLKSGKINRKYYMDKYVNT